MSGSPLRIRNYQADDLEALYRIDRICFDEDIAFSRAGLLYHLDHPKSIARVAEGLGRILGFVLAHMEGSARAHVITLDVIPEARKRKIGTLLMNTLHGELGRQGIHTTILEVGVRNVAAQRLYEKLQYRYLGTLAGYYHGREDAYRMTRVTCAPRMGENEKGEHSLRSLPS
jgi:ribosomal protein S18 acetylase RimI-like enzyme